jgi:predicted dinucleotide-utilizing enzyme
LANQATFDRLVEASKLYNKKVYVPCGAFWGASDIRKMANKGSLQGLKVTMKKHPDSLKVEGSLKVKLDKALPLTSELVLYEGSFSLKFTHRLPMHNFRFFFKHEFIKRIG